MKRNIRTLSLTLIRRLVKIFLVLFIFLITATIIAVSVNYFNPDFNKGFLAGKEELFKGIFPYGLYTHVITAPLLMVLTTILIFFRLEYKFPKTHRLLGKIIVILGFFLFVPSSFILAAFAMGGIWGVILFMLLSTLSFISLFIAYRSIRKKEIARHRRWMLRFYIFLISAIFLRINQFIFAYYFGMHAYLWAALLSWLPQWMILEMIFLIQDYRKKLISS